MDVVSRKKDFDLPARCCPRECNIELAMGENRDVEIEADIYE